MLLCFHQKKNASRNQKHGMWMFFLSFAISTSHALDAFRLGRRHIVGHGAIIIKTVRSGSRVSDFGPIQQHKKNVEEKHSTNLKELVLIFQFVQLDLLVFFRRSENAPI